MMKRLILSLVALPLVLIGAQCPTGSHPQAGKKAAEPLRIEFLNSFSFPSEFAGKENQFIGISSLAFDAHGNILYAASDDSGFCKTLGMWNCPDSFARMYALHLSLEHDASGKTLVKGEFAKDNPRALLDAQKSKITTGKVDFEGMTATHQGYFLLISEQDVSAAIYYPPSLHIYNRAGELFGSPKLPQKFFSAWGGGCRRNRCFEGVSAIPNTEEFVAITEQPLAQDRKTSYSRFLHFKLPLQERDGEVVVLGEHPYEFAPLEDALTEGSAKVARGVSDLLAIGPNDYLTVERSFIPYADKSKTPLSVIRVFRTTCDHCDELAEWTASLDWLKDIKPMKKTLFVDMLNVHDESGAVINNLNIEGITWGPTLPDGSSTIIFVSDNGDNTKNPTRFLVFKTNLHPVTNCGQAHQEFLCHN
jgi:hypothetical protein